MKKLYYSFLLLSLPFLLLAQAPESFNYQAIVRGSSGNEITNQTVGIQISLLQYTVDGSAVYIERFTTETNKYGLINIKIGTGDTQSGTFNSIDWSDGPYFLKTELDEDGGTTYTDLGTNQLLSVPYSMHSNTAESVTGTITESQISDLGTYLETETDPSVPIATQTGEMQYWDGSEWITVVAGSEGQVLTFTGGVPTWKTQLEEGEVENPTTCKIWMNRNLGASQVATSSTDADAYGDLYQWGRAADGHESRTSNTTSTLSSTDDPGHGDFIPNGSSPYDWRNPQNDDLWQGVSGTNNPCPSGYRLPTEAEWEAERTSWSSNDAAGAFASPLKLPLAGGRYYSNGSLYNVGSFGYYWSSTVDGTSSRYLNFGSSHAYMYSNYRALGSSVRCLKD